MKNIKEREFTLITGAGAGIGRAAAKEFAAMGHNLLLIDKDENNLQKVKNEIAAHYPVLVINYIADLSVEQEVYALYEKVSDHNVTLWINNAGIGDYGKVWEVDVHKIVHLLDLNVKALALLSILYIKDNCDQEKQLINISSTAGYSIYNLAVSYCASKFFISSFTEGIAQNLVNAGKLLKVKLFAPGAVNTDFEKTATTGSSYQPHSWQGASSAEQAAAYIRELYESDSMLGIMTSGRLELRDAIYPYS